MHYHNIIHDDMRNGDGLRVTLFVSGCTHHCKNCQNPETWDLKSGILFDKNAEDEIFEQLNQDYISGITFTGGDPLNESNRFNIQQLVNKIKALYPTKTIWLYTGYVFEDLINLSASDIALKDILEGVDVLIDGRYDETLRNINLKWRGSSNQRIINVPKSLDEGTVICYYD